VSIDRRSSATDRPALPRALIVLLLVSTVARLALAGVLDLGQDEAYALAISRPFQWSFFDHPPMAFWIAGAMQALFGRDIAPFLLRLPFVLMFSGTLFALFCLTRRIYGERAGLWAVGLLTAAPFFFASAGSWVVPDGPLLLFLMLAALFLLRALPASSGWRDWLLAGLFLGLALLSKYQAVPAAVGALIVLLLPANRHWLARPQPYIAAALALALFLPVIIWNAENGWISFAFQLGRGGSAHLDIGKGLVLLAGEAIYLLPWTMVGLVVAAFSGPRRPIFLALALPAILLFNVLPFLGASSLPHWSMSGWIFLFPPLGALLAQATEQGRRWPRILGAASALAMAVIAIGAVALLSNFRIYAGNADLNHYLAEATSWTGVRDGLAEKGLLDRPNTFLAATSWLDAAHIAEALRPAAPPVVLGSDPRGFAFLDSPNRHLGEDAIFVAAPESAAAVRRLATAAFASVEEIGTFTTRKGGVPAYAHEVFLAHDFRTPIAAPYGVKP
jgi:4-amino-4-deoxy-L-arabinose transferase-like glycosyltransferase